MSKRLIPASKIEAKRIRKMMSRAKNNTEKKRIEIVAQYLWWSNMNKVTETMLISKSTVVNAVNRYKKSWDNFYKTKWKWRQEDEYHKKLAIQAREMVEWEDNVDINEVRRKLEKMNWEEYGYEKIHWLIRRKLWYNYQKPFVTSNKQSEYAKEIAEWRLRKWLYQIAMEEWKIDAESVKNKKI